MKRMVFYFLPSDRKSHLQIGAQDDRESSPQHQMNRHVNIMNLTCQTSKQPLCYCSLSGFPLCVPYCAGGTRVCVCVPTCNAKVSTSYAFFPIIETEQCFHSKIPVLEFSAWKYLFASGSFTSV